MKQVAHVPVRLQVVQLVQAIPFEGLHAQIISQGQPFCHVRPSTSLPDQDEAAMAHVETLRPSLSQVCMQCMLQYSCNLFSNMC